VAPHSREFLASRASLAARHWAAVYRLKRWVEVRLWRLYGVGLLPKS
jgi:hypothetical protein